MLKTRRQRLFLVLLVASVTGGVAYATFSKTILHPETWYFYTVESGGIDIRSPTRRIIIDRDSTRGADWAVDRLRARWRERCTFEPSGRKSTILSYSHRGIALCNAADLLETDFETRRAYFISEVDELYQQYYTEVRSRTLTGVGYGLALWFLVFGAAALARWIWRGPAT